MNMTATEKYHPGKYPLAMASMPSRFDINSGKGARHVCEADDPSRDGSVLATLWKIPTRFWEDHTWNRCLPGGIIEKANQRYKWVWLSEADRLELISDARYYITEADYLDGGPSDSSAYSLIYAIARTRPESWAARRSIRTGPSKAWVDIGHERQMLENLYGPNHD